jgi:hypothetical protein
MCRGGVEWIHVMFDVLDYYILYMCAVIYILYTYFEGSRSGRQTKQDFFKKKSFPDEHKNHMR